MKIRLNVFIITTTLLIGGCTFFTSPMERSIIEDHSRGVTTFATIPSRRMVIVKKNDNGKCENNEEIDNIIICAEPSPDVSDNIASSLAAAITAKASASGNNSGQELSANISKELITNAQYLLKRSQGLQLYRDGMYNLCQARMNGIIDNNTYKKKASELLNIAIDLIKIEIPYLTTQTTSITGTNPQSNHKGATSEKNK